MQTNLNTLILIREKLDADRTIGTMLYHNRLCIRTIEPPYYPPENLLHNTTNTAVPFATYRLCHHDSPRHGLQKLLLCDVPRRSGILIHAGNIPADTLGCILTGIDIHNGRLTESRAALRQLETLARNILHAHREIYLHITR